MKRYLINEMKCYLALVPDASEEEISELKKWVAEGNIGSNRNLDL